MLFVTVQAHMACALTCYPATLSNFHIRETSVQIVLGLNGSDRLAKYTAEAVTEAGGSSAGFDAATVQHAS